jgi:hypothetical protein
MFAVPTLAPLQCCCGPTADNGRGWAMVILEKEISTYFYASREAY